MCILCCKLFIDSIPNIYMIIQKTHNNRANILIKTRLLLYNYAIFKHPIQIERILGSNWGFGSLYILIIAKEICSVCLINPYGNFARFMEYLASNIYKIGRQELVIRNFKVQKF